MSRITLLQLLLLLSLPFGITAQEMPEIFPVSPKAAELSKHGNVPINLSGGQIQYSVPIYTLSERGVSWPINLSYAYNGFLVEGRASEVGLGWSLSGTGAVVREVRGGLPDEHHEGFWGTHNRRQLIQDYRTLLPEDMSYSVVDDFKKGLYDMEADNFSINAPGLSVSFVLDAQVPMTGYLEYNETQKELILTSPENYRIKFNWDEIIVTNEMGITYTFAHKEMTTLSLPQDASGELGLALLPEYPSSWFISTITLQNGEIITFQYDSKTIKSYGYSESYEKARDWGESINLNCGQNNKTIDLGDFTRHTQRTHESITVNQFLTSITSPRGEILIHRDFTTSSNMPPLVQGVEVRLNGSLTPLAVYSLTYQASLLKTVSVNGQGKFDFEYDGFTTIPAYNQDISQPGSALQQDFWGFYNGALQNSSVGSTMPEKGADRLTSFRHTKLGALEKITYPTGGTTEITYEQNKYRISKSEYLKHFRPQAANWRMELELSNDVAYDTKKETYELSFTEDTYAKISHEAWLAGGAGSTLEMKIERLEGVSECMSTVGGNGYHEVAANLRNNDPENHPNFCPSLGVYLTGDSGPTGSTACGSAARACALGASNGWILMSAGTYRFTIESTPAGYSDTYGRITVEYYKMKHPGEPNSLYTEIDGGGIRVAQTTDCPNNGQPCVTKYYKYTDTDGISSGIHLGELDREYSYLVKDAWTCAGFGGFLPEQTKYEYWMTMHQYKSINPLETHAGSPIYYDRVEVWEDTLMVDSSEETDPTHLDSLFTPNGILTRLIDNDLSEYYNIYPANGKVVHHYSNQSIAYQSVNPVPPRLTNPWRGLEEKTEYFRFNPSDKSLTKIKEENHHFNKVSGGAITGYYGLRLGTNIDIRYDDAAMDINAVMDEKLQGNIYSFYKVELPTKFIQSYTISNDFETGITTRTDQHYDSRFQLSETLTSNSQGQEVKSIQEYAYDLTGTGYQEMLNLNVLATPVKQRAYENGLLTSSMRTEFLRKDNMILPSQIFIVNTDGNEEPRLTYHAYDSKGNPVEFSKDNGQHHAISWNTAGTHPLAKVTGASADQIYYNSFEHHLIVSNQGAHSGNRFETDYTLNLPDLPSGEYVLSYWKKVGNEWQPHKETVTVSTNGLNKIITGAIDELRVHPVGAKLITKNYDHLGRILTECTTNGLVIRYEYDTAGRLVAIRDMEGNIINAYQYNYSNK